MYVEVLVEITAKAIDKTFTYHVPNILEKDIVIGKRVVVPFASRKLEGFILNIHNNKPEYDVKDIISIVDEYAILNEEQIELGSYLSKKTFASLTSCFQTMLPAALKAHLGFTIPKKFVSYIYLNDDNYVPKNKSQEKIIELLKEKDGVLKKEISEISSSSLKTLLSKKIVYEEIKEIYRINDDIEKEEKKIVLNEEQKCVVDRVIACKNIFKPFLLFGVTGSGKTEVYMHIIEEMLKDGKEVIVLVPEISLTPQMVNLFKKRFGNLVAILHSRLSNGEKYDEWRKIEKKEVSIVIGARSAIFAPFTNLGCIIIDEEQTDTYRQENNPRYHAIDVALWRSKRHNCPMILGSATPSIESFTRAKVGVYELLTLKNRVNKSLPTVKLIDMKDMMRSKNKVISIELLEHMQLCLSRNEQIILLLNRRGFSTTITCKECGFTHKCPNCDIPLTYHKTTNSMRCHYCGYTTYRYKECPECHSSNINEFGMGTEKLEQTVKELFPNNRVIRMDVDTTTKKGSHERIVNKFRNHEYDILIGTQMISKGLDFPNVTLVGVLNGDASLNIPDFRSSERTFQLLNQVSGRAGRGDKQGFVYIQSFNIDHYSIVLASTNDYLTFYEQEINIRKKLMYPPFMNLLVIRITSKDYNKAYEEGKKMVTFLNSKLKNVIVLGPSSANMPKINNIYYLQIIIKYKKTKEIYNEVKYLNDHYKKNNKVKVEMDFNPLHI